MDSNIAAKVCWIAGSQVIWHQCCELNSVSDRKNHLHLHVIRLRESTARLATALSLEYLQGWKIPVPQRETKGQYRKRKGSRELVHGRGRSFT